MCDGDRQRRNIYKYNMTAISLNKSIKESHKVSHITVENKVLHSTPRTIFGEDLHTRGNPKAHKTVTSPTSKPPLTTL